MLRWMKLFRVWQFDPDQQSGMRHLLPTPVSFSIPSSTRRGDGLERGCWKERIGFGPPHSSSQSCKTGSLPDLSRGIERSNRLIQTLIDQQANPNAAFNAPTSNILHYWTGTVFIARRSLQGIAKPVRAKTLAPSERNEGLHVRAPLAEEPLVELAVAFELAAVGRRTSSEASGSPALGSRAPGSTRVASRAGPPRRSSAAQRGP